MTCSGPVSGERTSADPSMIETSLRSPLPNAETGVQRVAPMIACSAASSRDQRPPTSTGCSPKSCQSATQTSAQRSGIQSFSALLVATTMLAAGRSSGAKNSRCHGRSSGHGPSFHSTGSGSMPNGLRNSRYWSWTCCIGRGSTRRLVKSQLRSRARARSKPSFVVARVIARTSPALK